MLAKTANEGRLLGAVEMEEVMKQTGCKVMENMGPRQEPHRSTKAEAEQGPGRKLRSRERDSQRGTFVREARREAQ